MTNHERLSAIIETIRIRKGAANQAEVMPFVIGMVTAFLNETQLEAMEEASQYI
jgi:hypothetical protein